MSRGVKVFGAVREAGFAMFRANNPANFFLGRHTSKNR